MTAFIYISIALALQIGLGIHLWRHSDHKQREEIYWEREQFRAHMKALDEEEAGAELLSKFKSRQELKQANERLNKIFS